MAKRKKLTETTEEGFPLSLYHRDVFCNLQMKCPITGDLIYTGQTTQNRDVMVLLPNPDAREHQREYLLRS